MSTGLDYPPGATPTRTSSSALSAEATRLGGIYHTHVRYGLGDRFLDPFRRSDRDRPAGRHPRPHHALLPAHDGARRRGREMLGLVEDARESGLDVTFDGYPYAYSSTPAEHRDPAVGVRRRPRPRSAVISPIRRRARG